MTGMGRITSPVYLYPRGMRSSGPFVFRKRNDPGNFSQLILRAVRFARRTVVSLTTPIGGKIVSAAVPADAFIIKRRCTVSTPS